MMIAVGAPLGNFTHILVPYEPAVLQQHQTTAPYTIPIPIQAHSKEISLVIGNGRSVRDWPLSSVPWCGCGTEAGAVGRGRRLIRHAVQLINEQTRRSFWWTDLGGPTPPCMGNSGPINLMHILTEPACNHSFGTRILSSTAHPHGPVHCSINILRFTEANYFPNT